MGKMFEFELKDTVRLIMSEEEGIVVGRAEFTNSCNSYNVRFVAADGRQVEAWFPEDALGHRPR